jgi:hypothetical protein
VKRTLVAFSVLLLTMLTGAVGHNIGLRNAPDAADAERAYKNAYTKSFDQSRAKARKSAIAEGLKEGAREGKIEGSKNGGKSGYAEGRKDADIELARIRAEQAAAEAAERQANCGAPYFLDDYCPTDEELQYEIDAETYCGGGRHEEAAARGIQC